MIFFFDTILYSIKRPKKILTIFVLATGLIIASTEFTEGKNICSYTIPEIERPQTSNNTGVTRDPFSVLKLKIQTLRAQEKYSPLQTIADSLMNTLDHHQNDSIYLAEQCYYIGVCEIFRRQSDAVRWFEHTIEIKKKLKIEDDHYAKSIFNLGVIYAYFSDSRKVAGYMLEYIPVASKLYGEESSDVVSGYSALIGAKAYLHDFSNLTDYIFSVLGILGRNNTAVGGIELSDLYHNIGIAYINLGDYSKARIYLEEAEDILVRMNRLKGESYINLVNSLAITYGFLGMTKKETEYFEKGIAIASSNNSYYSLNMVNTYVIGLANSGDIKKGDNILSDLLKKAKLIYGTESPYYIDILRCYAEYNLKNKKDFNVAGKLFSECIKYVDSHKENIVLYKRVKAGYSESLFRSGETDKALAVIQDLLFNGQTDADRIYDNPPPDSLRTDKLILAVLRLKHEILRSIYSRSRDDHVLIACAATSQLIITMVDRLRINISEDESRILLGDRYRESYLNAISDFELCYRNTGNRDYLEKAFEFAERSKVAGLLTATREMNAIQFQIPPEIAGIENSLIREISFYNSRLGLENEKPEPDPKIISEYKTRLLSAVKTRDSLIVTFERDFPGYYSIKYMNDVPSTDQIPSIIGRNNNYLNYIISDSSLYIFLVNRKYREIYTRKTDPAFFDELREFRLLLSDANASFDAGRKFERYRQISYDIYKSLIEPVSNYFISDNIIISPDNILSYIPFEAITTAPYNGKDILYRELRYLMNDFNISYSYSAAYMKEIGKRRTEKTNRLVAFAPVYTKSIDPDSLIMKRLAGNNKLYDLQYARQEAKYVCDLTGGKMYINNDAKESVFKSEAGKYDIVHLAMHTVLNDQNPMNSAMIFSQVDDRPEDGFLLTSEVYGIPLKARMVVLSSCNTGTGLLSSGEGILSLARGFLFSGSRSVVMSMWEVDDRSGTEIIRLFYHYLKKGMSKSAALKKTRSEYLKHATQVKSHPYYWSTLVIYGDDSGLFFPWKKALVAGGLAIAVVFFVLIYLLKPRYS